MNAMVVIKIAALAGLSAVMLITMAIPATLIEDWVLNLSMKIRVFSRLIKPAHFLSNIGLACFVAAIALILVGTFFFAMFLVLELLPM